MKAFVMVCLLASLVSPAFGQTSQSGEQITATLRTVSMGEKSPKEKLKILEDLRDQLFAAPKTWQKRPDAIPPVEELEMWLQLINQTDMLVDKSWDPEKRYFLNVAPPEGSGIEPGMSPDEIKDPKLRAIYEADIKENSEYARYYDEQYAIARFIKIGIDSMRRSKVLQSKEITPDVFAEKVGEYIYNSDLQKTILAVEKSPRSH